jgi:Anti-sigma-K factor rskA/Sigma-70, region 4
MGGTLSFAFMATFDQLSADQRAIIELILQRGQSYDELSGKLGMPETRVRELARDALVRLAPVTAQRVEDDWRGQLADYVLGQQARPESTATRGHLRRSEAARSWARSLLDSLDTLYANGLPAIPDGDRGRRGRERRPEPEAAAAAAPKAPARRRSPQVRSAAQRRRLLAGGGVLAVILVAVLLWPIGLLTGGADDESGSARKASSTASRTGSGAPAGVAVIAEQDGKRTLVVQAANLRPSQQGQAYEVWLYNSPQDAKSLGAQVTNDKGQYQGAGPLPSDYARYKFVDVSLEPIDRNRAHSGQSVLRGRLGKLKQAPANVKKGQPAILGQVVLLPPQG